MKKVAFIIAVAMLAIGLAGCDEKSEKTSSKIPETNAVTSASNAAGDKSSEEKKTETEAKVETEIKVGTETDAVLTKTGEIAPQVEFFAEDDNYIFSVNSNGEGFSRIDKKTKKSKCIYDRKDSYDYFLTEKSIYFTHEDAITEQGYRSYSVWGIDKDGGNLTKIFDSTQYPDMDYIYNIKVFGNKLLISASEPGLLMYDMTTKETTKLLDAIQCSYHMINDTLYYDTGSEKTFAIAKKDLKTLKEEVILSKDQPSPRNMRCDELMFIKDKMYFTTRFPCTLSVLDNGVPKIIYESKEEYSVEIAEYRGNLYFVTNNSDSTDQWLYKHDVETKAVTKLVDLKGHNAPGFKLVNGYVYYGTDDSIHGSYNTAFAKLPE